jgi:uncharacterized membrane protein YgcG
MRRVLLLLLFTTSAFGKSLHWSAINVDARVDGDGNLHVSERQSIVFDGDWNGGERDFNLRPRQDLEIGSIKRIDGTTEIPLTRGDLSSVDHWDTTSSGVVRWRSRLPSDPPFENREITYVLDVTYSNVLVDEGNHRYRLNHDFGLPKRDGVIEHFSLYVAFDPVWTSSPASMERTNVPPGVHAIVDRELTYSGAGDPAGVVKPLPVFVPLAVLLLFGLGTAFLASRFAAGERPTGRFAPVVATFDEEVLSMSAEVAGAAWDGSIGAPEVAAVLARMTQEGKLSTNVQGKKLHMKLLVDRSTLHGYERDLVAAFFSSGHDSTDTDAVRARYQSTGFDPSKYIKPGIEKTLAAIPGWGEKVKRFSGRTDALLILGALLLLAASTLMGGPDGGTAIVSFFIILFFSGLTTVIAVAFTRSAITNLRWALTAPAITMALACAPLFAFCLLARTLGQHAPVLFAIALFTLAWMNLAIDLMRIKDSSAKIAFRKRIAGTRTYFIEQLALPKPSLRDEWFPYVLAFGLGTNVDRWFRAYGAMDSASAGAWSSASSSSSTSSSSPSWTGGGGAFGGAGATGSWAIAAGSMAAGVSAPSSSSSGGGGSSGGSSSGGGGGGGW